MNQRAKRKRILIILLLYLFTTLFIISLIKNPTIVNKKSGLIVMSDFEGCKPFQYRVLIPSLIRVIEFITPTAIKNTVDDIMADFLITRLEKSHPELPEYKIDRIK